jgi:hypothetical protein
LLQEGVEEAVTVNELKQRIAALAKSAADYRDCEYLHGEEDRIWSDVLCEIAAGAPNAAELAAEAFKTKRIEFDRWYS